MRRVLVALCLSIFLIGIAQMPMTHAEPPRPMVAAYYFPGWHTEGPYLKDLAKHWPERLPLLGSFPEEDPRGMASQIDQAADNGLDAFVFDWYWETAGATMDHAVEAFKKAPNRHRMQYALMWANHNDRPQDMGEVRQIVRHWVQSHFRQPNYWREEDRPVVIIFSPYQLRKNMVGRANEAIAVMNEEAREHGLPGLHIVGCIWPREAAINLRLEGYQAMTGYNYPGAWRWIPGGKSSFKDLTQGYQWAWSRLMRQAGALPYLVPVLAGWDKRPWGGPADENIPGPTAEEFEIMLRNAQELCRQEPSRTGNTVLITAWNEYAEGSYVAPTRGRGSELLDVIRKVFGLRQPVQSSSNALKMERSSCRSCLLSS